MTRAITYTRNRFPILNWAPEYSGEKFVRDVIAGLTVGLTVIPQGLAYAVLAGLPTQYGLYSSFMGVFVYCLLGTSKDITLGPTAIMSMLVAVFCKRPDSWPEEFPPMESTTDPMLAVQLTFLTGVILVTLGLFNLGFVVNFISHAVICGFCSAASFIIAAGQLKKLFGIKLHHREFFHMVPELVQKIFSGHVNWYDFAMGMTCIVVLKSLELVKRRFNGREDINPILGKVIWLGGTARNAVVVVFASLIAYLIEKDNVEYWRQGCKPTTENCTSLTLTKIADASMPGFHLPAFQYSYNYTNATDDSLAEHTVTFSDMQSALGTGLFIIPLMAYLESISIAKGFAVKNNYKVDATQELLAIGSANALSAFVMSYPVTGSFSRTAVNSQSNVATPAGGLVCGTLVLLAALFLTPIFVYIPSACLGAVIILAAISMFDVDGIKHTWNLSTKVAFFGIQKAQFALDCIPMLLCFIFCFWDIAYGIIIGIIAHICILLFKVSKPEISHHESKGQILLAPRQGMFYPAAEYLADEIEKATAPDDVKAMHLDLGHVSEIDSGTADALKFTLSHVESLGVHVTVENANESVAGSLDNAGFKDLGTTTAYKNNPNSRRASTKSVTLADAVKSADIVINDLETIDETNNLISS